VFFEWRWRQTLPRACDSRGVPFLELSPVPGAATRPTPAEPPGFDGGVRETEPLEQTHNKWLAGFLRGGASSEPGSGGWVSLTRDRGDLFGDG
jgi:hypothetical protein